MRKILFLLLFGSLILSGIFWKKPIKKVEFFQNPPPFAAYLQLKPYSEAFKIIDFKEINKKEKLIESILGRYGGSCKAFTNKYAPILGLKVGKGKFHPKFSHYFLILSETSSSWEVLDSNFSLDLDGIIRRHFIKKY